MMYEGSDRDEVLRTPLARGKQEDLARQDAGSPPSRGRQEGERGRQDGQEAPLSMKTGAAGAGQKTYTKKPLTGRTPTEKTGTQQRPRLIGICNQKGGVGKTTTAVNLATALAAIGKNVAIIDMDPQGNASTGLGIRRSAIRTSVYDVLFEGADMVEAAVTTRVPNLSVIPSSIHLSGAEIELVTADNREFRLKKALHRPLPYDYVIIDCPPSLNLLTLNALVAADSILVPLQCEFYALEGLSHLVKTIERVQKSFNPGLDIHGIILTMFDLRNKLSAQVEEDVRGHFGDKVYKTVIPSNVRLSEAPSFGLPAIVYDMKCAGAQAYIKLAKEVIVRERNIAAANESGNDAQVA
jgi:chromosome partitioning protein